MTTFNNTEQALLSNSYTSFFSPRIPDFRIIVFCARCHETRYLAGFLGERGHSAVGLTGRMRQSERRRVLAEFVEGKARILVATDVASR